MFLVALLLLVPAVVAAQNDTLASARALYTSAEYEAALATLNRIRSGNVPADEFPAVEEYRALCLLALGRASEAEDAIAAVVTAAPSYALSDGDVSPRVRTAFSEVRRRVLPTVIQRRYAEAKAAFDRKDHVSAAAGFDDLLQVLADPAVAPLAAEPPLADLRTLAQGFHDLSVTAVAAPPALPQPPPAPSAEAPAPEPAPVRIYNAGDRSIVEPVVVRQDLPEYPGKPLFATQGVVEVVIDEAGMVEAASIRAAIGQAYDRLALEAARNWRYKPATRDGVPVKFRKLIQIKIQP